jgi:metal-responsive CopG/Arc/MetJ family transcriptional regulator
MTNYVTVKLPKELIQKIDTFLDEQNLGYTSRAEIVKDAVRTFLTTNSKHKPEQERNP